MKAALTAEQLIRLLDLKPHPEGGFFRETYRSDEFIPGRCLGPRYSGDRSYSTAIYYLLTEGAVSRLHRIRSDELWHFYLGGPLTIVELKANGSSERVVLGAQIDNAQRLQHVVKSGSWFGAYLEPGSDYSLVGCTVAPGFDFSDFQIAKRRELIKEYPRDRDIIVKLTRDEE